MALRSIVRNLYPFRPIFNHGPLFNVHYKVLVRQFGNIKVEPEQPIHATDLEEAMRKKYPTPKDLDDAIQEAAEKEYKKQMEMKDKDIMEYPEGLPVKNLDDLRNYDLNQLNLRLCDDDLNYLLTINGEDVLVPHIARTLEWVVSSPVEFHLFEEPPIIKSCPGY